MKNEALITKWLAGEATEEEKKLLMESKEFADMEKIWEGLSIATPPRIDVAEELARFHATHTKEAKVVKVAWHRRVASIAASVLLLAVFGYFLLRPSASQNTIALTEALKTFYLPDSSTVRLNKGSELTYDAAEWASGRKVHLQGEGFFQVKPGSTFEVLTPSGTVTVLGTSFNVKERGGYYEVICYEGKVGVTTAEEDLKLLAGDGFRDGAGTEHRFQVPTAPQPEWLQGKSSFLRTPYNVVLQEIENQYHVTIETEDLDLERTFTGSFPNDNLELALAAVTIPTGYQYQIEGDKVLITREKS